MKRLLSILNSKQLIPLLFVAIVALFVTRSFLQRKQLIEERTTLTKKVERLEYQLAETEWSLKMAQERKLTTVKVREERRPDGTTIVEREDAKEEVKTDVQQEGSSTVLTKSSSVVEQREEKESTYGSSRWGLDIGLHRQVWGDSRTPNRLSIGQELDYGIAPVIDLYFPNSLNGVNGLGVGVEVRL
jgi:hypothetical protein